MKRYHIRKYKQYEKATFYTIHEDGEADCETDKFFLRFKDKKKLNDDVQIIKFGLKKLAMNMVHYHGISDRSAKRLPYQFHRLNLNYDYIAYM